MPRAARASQGGIIYHVLNRGNAQTEVFHCPGDYEAFLALISESCHRLPMPVLGYCLMPNHFHLVVRPQADGDLGRWMQWLMTAHVRRYHAGGGSNGHVWQGRFKAFPVQNDGHFLTVLRYVERNPLRANMVRRAEHWQWSSLPWMARPDRPNWLHECPIPRPDEWLEWINQPQSDKELEAIKNCLDRGAPFGCDGWVKKTAVEMALESTLRNRGRPRGSMKWGQAHFSNDEK
jgi:putative transposase